ncbi:MAG: MarR family transcriptional regulator [Alphaproteobacteria bacterium]|nr:MarR family transcriptional regulator [Alphaproteobacteria bacterium]MBL7099908.1 MarR family transcriptional regulator [Alphaproteobacteria bacterium]
MTKRIRAGDPATDHVGRVHAQWRRELPDVDMEGSRIIGRARRITLLSRAKIEAVFARHGLDTGEFDVVATLRRAGSPYALRPTELYRALMISSGGLTDRLARLEERGLVRRRPSDEDKRSLLVELTAKGCVVAEAALREDMLVESAMVAALTAQERDQLAALLQKLAMAFETDEA